MIINIMLKILNLVALCLLMSCVTSLTSPKAPLQSEVPSCAIRKGEIQEPIKSVDYFKKELSDFMANEDYDYQLIYLELPGNDDIGSIVYCRVQNSEISLTKGNANEKRNFISKQIDFIELFEKIETGGYYQLCESKKSFDDFSIYIVKKKSKIIFEYQGINSGINLLGNDATLFNAFKLYDSLAK